MKKSCLITLCLLIIIGVSILLWFLKPQDKLSNIVQADAIIALVFVTLFYAGQTQELVKQERIALEDQIKKRGADFAERYLQQLYAPFSYKLFQIKNFIERNTNVEDMHSNFGKIADIVPEIAQFHVKFAFLNKKETLDATLEFIMLLSNFIPVIEKKEKSIFGERRQEVLDKIQSLEEYMDKEKEVLQAEISKVYGFIMEE